MTSGLTNFWVVALRVSVDCSKLSPHLSLRSSGVVLECRLDNKNVLGGPMSPRKEPQNGQRKEPQNGKDRKEPQNGQSKEPQNGQEEEQADTLTA